jgi:nicotinamidase/pyrazinamidase
MRALVLVDVQNDFMPDGALPVTDGYAVIPAIHALLAHEPYDLVVATQDWHPADHASFAAQHPGRAPGELIDLDGLTQVLWPVHCVAGTPGAEFVPALDARRVEAIFRKGTDRRIDSYSGFFDNGQRKATGLDGYLRARGVTHLDVCGVATDYCVRFTALDARRAGFEVRLRLQACRGVNLQPGDVDAAVEQLRQAGVEIA